MLLHRSYVVLACLLACVLLASGCSSSRDAAQEAIMVEGPDPGVIAVSVVGGRSVRILRVNPPSIVLLREVFLPTGERVIAVEWAPDGRDLIIATRASTFALNTRTWALERVVALAQAESKTSISARSRG